MKQVRQLLAIIMLSVASIILLSACGTNQESSGGKDITINILQGKVENNTQFKQIAANMRNHTRTSKSSLLPWAAVPTISAP